MTLFLAQLGVEMYFAEADGMMSHTGMANFYLYQFSGKNLFQFIAWDKDRTFFDINDSIWRGTKENVLTRRALESPELRQAYMEAFFFFFNDTATTEIYTLSLHDALPI